MGVWDGTRMYTETSLLVLTFVRYWCHTYSSLQSVLVLVQVLLASQWTYHTSENIDRQYELTPVKSTTVSLTTTPKRTLGQYFTPVLSIIRQRNDVVVQSRPPESGRDLDLAGRKDVNNAK